MEAMPMRRTGELHAFRWSAAGVRYFITCCTRERRPGLLNADIAGAIRAHVLAADMASDTKTIAFVIMPNHVHWLFELGTRLSLGRVVARFKARTRPPLLQERLAWQRDFYEHRLRPDEDVEAYAFYIFMNPYREGFTPHGVSRTWHSAEPGALRFISLIHPDGSLPIEWIDKPVPACLAIGDDP
jgi:putative transposase